MATYIVNSTDGNLLVTIPDGGERFLSFNNAGIAPNGVPTSNVAANASGTGIRLLGQNAIDYGLKMDENLVHLLENFADINQPDLPLIGQLWYDTRSTSQYPDGVLRVCTANTGNIEFPVVGGGGSAGNIGEIQFSDGKSGFNASPSLTWFSANTTLRALGNLSASGNLIVSSSANISNTVSIRANANSEGTLLLVLPPNVGVSGQSLSTDGSGNLYWRLNDSIADITGVSSIIASAGNLRFSSNSAANVLVISDTLANFSVNANISGNLAVTQSTLLSSLSVTGNTALDSNLVIANTAALVSLGPNSNIKIYGGNSAEFLSTDGSGNLSWAAALRSGLVNGSAIVVGGANANLSVNDTSGNIDIQGKILIGGANANLSVNAITGNISISGIIDAGGANANLTVDDANSAVEIFGNLLFSGGNSSINVNNSNVLINGITTIGNGTSNLTVDSANSAISLWGNVFSGGSNSSITVDNNTSNIFILNTGITNIGGANVSISMDESNGTINIIGAATISNIQAPVSANTTATVGNLITLTINGTSYQLMAL